MIYKGVIDEEDYKDIDTRIMKKCHPILEGLYPNLAWYNSDFEVTYNLRK